MSTPRPPPATRPRAGPDTVCARTATLPVTDCRRLTDHRLVQQTALVAGDLTVTANFGTRDYKGLSGGCVDVRSKGDPTLRRPCPAR